MHRNETLLKTGSSRKVLKDRFNRKLSYLRISVTDRCNLNCLYCAPPMANIPKISHDEVLRYEEILRVVRVGTAVGINKIRVTGGEPLVRKGICDFLKALGQLPGIEDISITTNAVLLKQHIKDIKSAGVRRLNISLDTLDRGRFRQITGADRFEQVWDGLMAAHAEGFSPIKLNTVAMRGVNDDELADIALLSYEYPFHLRFIEYMPIGDNRLDAGKEILAPEIMARLEQIAPLIPIANDRNDGPAERYKFPNAKGEIGFIRPMSHHFCDRCNRLRLTASGQLRPCLLSDRQIDVKRAIRSGCDDAAIADLFKIAAGSKPMAHQLKEPEHVEVKDAMSGIGG